MVRDEIPGTFIDDEAIRHALAVERERVSINDDGWVQWSAGCGMAQSEGQAFERILSYALVLSLEMLKCFEFSPCDGLSANTTVSHFDMFHLDTRPGGGSDYFVLDRVRMQCWLLLIKTGIRMLMYAQESEHMSDLDAQIWSGSPRSSWQEWELPNSFSTPLNQWLRTS